MPKTKDDEGRHGPETWPSWTDNHRAALGADVPPRMRGACPGAYTWSERRDPDQSDQDLMCDCLNIALARAGRA